jgi:hypothetical protein
MHLTLLVGGQVAFVDQLEATKFYSHDWIDCFAEEPQRQVGWGTFQVVLLSLFPLERGALTWCIRRINVQLYNSHSADAYKMMREDPNLYEEVSILRIDTSPYDNVNALS